jgi:hypothetical protein
MIMRPVTVSADDSSSVTGRQAGCRVEFRLIANRNYLRRAECNYSVLWYFASHILLICVVSSQSVMVPCIGVFFLQLHTELENLQLVY